MIDLKNIDNEIKNIKYPYIFLFNLVGNISNINDNNFSLILRIFLKHHMCVGLTTNLKKLMIDDLIKTNKIISLEVLNDFYKLLYKKISLIFVLKKWYLVYQNKEFWNINILEQNEFLINIRERFLSLFDCSKGGVPFYNKIAILLRDNKNDRKFIINNIIDRLIILVQIFETVNYACSLILIGVKSLKHMSRESGVQWSSRI